MSKTEEFTAIFFRERQRWEDTVLADVFPVNGSQPVEIPPILETAETVTVKSPYSSKLTLDLASHARRQLITVKGPADLDELRTQQTYRFYGHWEEYQNRRTSTTERQFHFTTFVRALPHGRAGVIRYLQGAPGIGQALSERLYEKFAGDAVRVLREATDVACAAVAGLTQAAASIAAGFLKEDEALAGCTIDLIDILGGRGFPKATAKKAVQRWGNKAAEILKRNPYLLMSFRGCGFLRCDAMYLSLGKNPAKLTRQAYCAWHTLASDTEGNTWHSVDVMVRGLRDKVSGVEACAASALRLARRGKLISTRRDENNRLWVAERKKAIAEEMVAILLVEAMNEDN